MKVRDLMKTDVVTCRRSDPLAIATRIMWEHDCGFVPVTDENGRLCGAVTDRDACMASFTQGRTLAQIAVADAMACPPVALDPGDDLERVHEAMRVHQVRRLPVVDVDGRVIGVVSLKDLATRARESRRDEERLEVARTLGAICHERDPLAALH